MFDDIFLYSAVIGGAILAFQFIMMMLGIADDGGGDLGGADGDLSGGMEVEVDADLGELGDAEHQQPTWSEAADADVGHNDSPWFYEMISLRTLSAAVAFFGLGGKTAVDSGFSDGLALMLAAVSGFAAMYAVYWLFKQVFKLETSGNENIRNAIGKSARVYVPIPGNDQGAGKVQFKMQQRLVEYQAVTKEDENLPTGENVVVVGIVNSDTVRVARAEQLAEA